MTYGAVTVTTSGDLILGANPLRKGCFIFNNSSSTIYIGPDASITTANAIPLLANATLENSGLQDSWRGSIYGIVGSGTADIRYWEWIQ